MNKPNDIYNILNTINSLESKDRVQPTQPNLLKILTESNTPLSQTIRTLNEKYAASKKQGMAEDGLPMTTVNGKKVPAFAADGKGKNDLGKGKDVDNDDETNDKDTDSKGLSAKQKKLPPGLQKAIAAKSESKVIPNGKKRAVAEEMKSWMRDPRDPESKIPAYRRKEKDVVDTAARRAVDKLNKDAGASVFRSARSSAMLEAELDMNLLKGMGGAMKGVNVDPESERNLEKKYGYRTDGDDTGNEDDYDEYGNLKKTAKKSSAVGGPKIKGRPRKNFGPERTTANAYKHKGSRINLETFVEDAMAELDSLVFMEGDKDDLPFQPNTEPMSDKDEFGNTIKNKARYLARKGLRQALADKDKSDKQSHDLNELARLAGLQSEASDHNANSMADQVEKLLKQFEQEAMEMGAYATLDLEAIVSLIAQGNVKGAADEVYGSFTDREGDEVEQLQPLVNDLEADFEELARNDDKMMEGAMSEIDLDLQDIAQSGDEEKLIDAMEGLHGTGVQFVLQDMMSDLVDKLADKGMNDVINDQDKMIELLMDTLVHEYKDRDDMEEGNEFSGALAKAKAAGAQEFEVDGKTFKVNEGGCDMGSDMAEQESGMNINSSMDTRTGDKTLSVTAHGEAAEQLARILKMAGMAGSVSHEPMEEPMEEYANAPDEKIASVDAAFMSGDDLHKKKKQYANMPKLGDNPMATESTNEIAEQLRRMYLRFDK